MRHFISMSLIILISLSTSAKESHEVEQVKAKPSFGLYVSEISDIDFAKNEFTTKFWWWFNHSDENFTPNTTMEIINAKSWNKTNTSTELSQNGKVWNSGSISANLKQEWDVRNYPFDIQRLKIILEDVNTERDNLQFTANDNQALIDSNALPDGWTLVETEVNVRPKTYQTAFGKPDNGKNESVFSRIEVIISLQRDGWRVFSTVFIGYFVALIMAVFLFSINIFDKSSGAVAQPARTAIGVGSLFAAVGATYVLAAKLPYTTVFTLADSIQITTFIGVILSIICSILTDVSRPYGKIEHIIKVNRLIFGGFVVSALIINAYMLISGN